MDDKVDTYSSSFAFKTTPLTYVNRRGWYSKLPLTQKYYSNKDDIETNVLKFIRDNETKNEVVIEKEENVELVYFVRGKKLMKKIPSFIVNDVAFFDIEHVVVLLKKHQHIYSRRAEEITILRETYDCWSFCNLPHGGIIQRKLITRNKMKKIFEQSHIIYENMIDSMCKKNLTDTEIFNNVIQEDYFTTPINCHDHLEIFELLVRNGNRIVPSRFVDKHVIYMFIMKHKDAMPYYVIKTGYSENLVNRSIEIKKEYNADEIFLCHAFIVKGKTEETTMLSNMRKTPGIVPFIYKNRNESFIANLKTIFTIIEADKNITNDSTILMKKIDSVMRKMCNQYEGGSYLELIWKFFGQFF